MFVIFCIVSNEEQRLCYQQDELEKLDKHAPVLTKIIENVPIDNNNNNNNSNDNDSNVERERRASGDGARRASSLRKSDETPTQTTSNGAVDQKALTRLAARNRKRVSFAPPLKLTSDRAAGNFVVLEILATVCSSD
jgi:hypothetical protein